MDCKICKLPLFLYEELNEICDNCELNILVNEFQEKRNGHDDNGSVNDHRDKAIH